MAPAPTLIVSDVKVEKGIPPRVAARLALKDFVGRQCSYPRLRLRPVGQVVREVLDVAPVNGFCEPGDAVMLWPGARHPLSGRNVDLSAEWYTWRRFLLPPHA
jgi:hypothetical protein